MLHCSLSVYSSTHHTHPHILTPSPLTPSPLTPSHPHPSHPHPSQPHTLTPHTLTPHPLTPHPLTPSPLTTSHPHSYACTRSGHLFEIHYKTIVVKRVWQPLPSNTKEGGAAINVLALHAAFCVTGSEDGVLRVWPPDWSAVYLEAGEFKEITWPPCSTSLSLSLPPSLPPSPSLPLPPPPSPSLPLPPPHDLRVPT